MINKEIIEEILTDEKKLEGLVKKRKIISERIKIRNAINDEKKAIKKVIFDNTSMGKMIISLKKVFKQKEDQRKWN